MFIKRIEVENFKSFFARQSIQVGRKNIFIGKNGSGKSNLLTALSALFLYGEERRPQHNNNEEPSSVEVEVDNSDRRFLLPSTFVLKAIFKDGPEFIINDKPISKEELRGLLENAGFTHECFVMQGKVNDIALMNSKERFKLISRIAGVEKYEDSKALAISLLNEESEEKIEALIEKIELKMKISEEYKRKAEEYDKLCKSKAEAEFELLNYELKELNDEIGSIEIGQTVRAAEQDEGMLEFEIRACKEEMDKLALKINETEEFLEKFDRMIVNQIKEKLAKDGPNNINPYDHKVSVLSKAQLETVQKLEEEEKKEKEKYIELKALRFLDALPVKVSSDAARIDEEIRILEEQLRIKREEIRNFKSDFQSKENYKSLISQRKQLWIKDKQIKEELKSIGESEKSCENKILYLGKLSINIYEMLKNSAGVVGTVFSLFDIPDNLLDAFEAVTRNSLFWIVVEDDEVATKLVDNVEGRVTFVALNRVSTRTRSRIRIESVHSLSDSIECDQKYKNLLEMICRDYYVSSNATSALEISEKYNINVVTLEGDIFSKNGTITGGYENSNQILKELKNCKRRMRELKEELRKTTGEISAINEKVKYSELGNEDDSRVLDNLHAVERYLSLKIELLRSKRIVVPEIPELEMEHLQAQERIPKIRLELESIESQMARASEKKMKIDEAIQKVKLIESSAVELENLKSKEKSLIDSLYLKKANENIEESSKLQRKHLLIDRRTHLMRKIGVSDFKSIFIKHSKDELISSLKEINKKLKVYSGFSKREILDDQRSELRQRLEELRISKSKILEFISTLDRKKEDTFNLSFSMISDNYSFFFRKFTGKSSNLHLRNEGIDITVDGRTCDLPSMSGGQKTVIALSIIFAIQKNDPSPFYVFDEIDANLDMEHCLRLSEIIRESSSQYFISTFKAEMIEACDRYYGVISRDKQSYVDEISKELACETIRPAQ
ncbi:uncharacterized protein VICG_01646 [Vittaforma corneae ATCC 50505]|uniref:SMC hinge domain-containing protein n=1 Tax=Vittaforma corneae (strain ATCC 50505) TaxID=993615 RepID=L2GK65_VITCO|nr:uncharacterized protein VICG_01646 [Vittaforma corneae ATCC 50505]ELA41273.1 hypothetical protein VICG_01646 [Vittaforma corneae ATCC 50505]